MRNICIFCGGDIKEEVVRVIKEKEDEVIIIENVPAGVCTQCGEREYEAKIISKLEKILNQHLGIKKERVVPIADFSLA